MFVVVGPVGEVVLALEARVGTFARVLATMCGQDTLETEALATELACEGHGARVYPAEKG